MLFFVFGTLEHWIPDTHTIYICHVQLLSKVKMSSSDKEAEIPKFNSHHRNALDKRKHTVLSYDMQRQIQK